MKGIKWVVIQTRYGPVVTAVGEQYYKILKPHFGKRMKIITKKEAFKRMKVK